MTAWIFGGFLVIHGLIHLAWIAPAPDDANYPFSLERSPALPTASSQLLRPLGIALVAASVVLFLVAGLGVMGLPGFAAVWRLAAVAGGILSALLIATFWNPWFVVGALLDLAILGAVLLGWPHLG